MHFQLRYCKTLEVNNLWTAPLCLAINVFDVDGRPFLHLFKLTINLSIWLSDNIVLQLSRSHSLWAVASSLKLSPDALD